MRNKIKYCLGYVMYPLVRMLPYSDTKLVGPLAKTIRSNVGKLILKSSGKSINIEKNALFSRLCSIGDRSGIGINAKLYGEIVIGNDVMMGPDCIIYAANHKFDDISIPMNQQGSVSKPVVIRNDVWIGARVTILPGVMVNSHSVIAAGAIVTSDVPEYAVVGGFLQKSLNLEKTIILSKEV